jgi:hypothetical protein
MRIPKAVVVVVLGVVLLAAGVFFGKSVVGASSPSTTYYGCLSAKKGTLTNVGTVSPSTCKTGAQVISWNSDGPTGAQGEQGPQGATGPSAETDGQWDAQHAWVNEIALPAFDNNGDGIPEVFPLTGLTDGDTLTVTGANLTVNYGPCTLNGTFNGNPVSYEVSNNPGQEVQMPWYVDASSAQFSCDGSGPGGDTATFIGFQS